MKPLTIICPNPKDATSFYRGIGPFGTLMDEMKDFECTFPNSVSWDAVKISSGVFMQRPFTTQHVQICEIVKSNKKNLWIDYDDYLLNVPMDNPTWGIYGDPAIKENIIKCLVHADVVSVSTPYLEECLRQEMINAEVLKNPGVTLPEFHVIPNAYDESLFTPAQRHEKRPKLIVWRGSETHVRDVLTYAEEIIEISNQHPDWTWLFVGMPPWMLIERMPKGRCIWQKALDPIQYNDYLKGCQPDICIVPLHFSPFNLCKSNIAWIEATHAGAVVLAPDAPEWRKPGVTTYNNQADFKNGLLKLMGTSGQLKQTLNKMSLEHIQRELTLKVTNKKRAEILSKWFQIT